MCSTGLSNWIALAALLISLFAAAPNYLPAYYQYRDRNVGDPQLRLFEKSHILVRSDERRATPLALFVLHCRITNSVNSPITPVAFGCKLTVGDNVLEGEARRISPGEAESYAALFRTRAAELEELDLVGRTPQRIDLNSAATGYLQFEFSEEALIAAVRRNSVVVETVASSVSERAFLDVRVTDDLGREFVLSEELELRVRYNPSKGELATPQPVSK